MNDLAREFTRVVSPDGSIVVTIALDIPSTANRREHHFARARRARTQREAVARALNPCPPHALPCVVTITRIASRRLDSDNLQSACKSIRDQIASWLGCDDNDDAPIAWNYSSEITRETRREIVRRRGAIYMADVPACVVRIEIRSRVTT